MDDIAFSRKQLYDMVWSDSLVTVSKKDNISDSGLTHGDPLAGHGHWNKVKAGKKVRVIPG